MRLMRHDEKQKELEIKNFGSKKIGFQHWRLINHVQAKEFIHPGGHLFVNYFFFGGAVEVV